MEIELWIFLIAVMLIFFAINRWIFVTNAHKTFENYYAFRGWTKLLKRTNDYALCKVNNDQTIKIVKFNNKWYLDGDLPTCINNFCFWLL